MGKLDLPAFYQGQFAESKRVAGGRTFLPSDAKATFRAIGYGACGALLRTISLSLEGTDRRNPPSDNQRENDDNGSHRGHGGRCADEVRHHTGKQSARDRKSTRLNSSHLGISYAVFCLKK